VAAKQKEADTEIGSDGGQQIVGFQTYVPERICGLSGEPKRATRARV
jgi:hypothetical protein